MVDRRGVKPNDRTAPLGYVPPEGVHNVIQLLGPTLLDGGASYLQLAATVDRFLAARDLQSWNQLDVAQFVHEQAQAGHAAHDVCCDISALIPHLLSANDLTPAHAERIWVELSSTCGDHPAALAYIELGLQMFLEQKRKNRKRWPTFSPARPRGGRGSGLRA